MKMGFAARNLASVVEMIETAQHGETMIDSGRRGLGQQIVAIGAQGAERKLAQSLGIEKSIGPGEFTALPVEQPIRRGARQRRTPQNELKSHGDSASSRQRIKSSPLAPARKKPLGSWLAGR